MKLAEALMLRAELQKRLASLRERLEHRAMIQEGDKSVEDPAELFRRAKEAATQMERLVSAINKANIAARLEDGRTITEALAARDLRVWFLGTLRGVAKKATEAPERYGSKEIRWLPNVDVPALHEQADELAREIRELNAGIQAANWRVEIEP
jgi:hypothetical protein